LSLAIHPIQAISQTGPASGYILVDNFSGALPSTAKIRCVADADEKHAGLAAMRMDYDLGDAGGQDVIQLSEDALRIEKNGTVSIWVKGDGSANTLQFTFRSSDAKKASPGALTVTLNEQGWKQYSFRLSGVAARSKIWVSTLTLKVVGNPEARKTSGKVWLDEMQLAPDGGTAKPSVTLKLAGETVRDYTADIHYNLDIRNLGQEPFTTSTTLEMHDRNRNHMATRRFDFMVGPGESREIKIELKPENMSVYRPPFTITGDLSSPDNSDVDASVDQVIVMGNSYLLFDDFSNVFGRWFTAGAPFIAGGANGYLFGEQQHADARLQTAASIKRVSIDKAPATGGKPGPGAYAMQIDFNASAMVFNGLHRFLPGDAYRMGLWVKGDGSGAKCSVAVLDFALAGATFYNWNRDPNYSIPVCTLDFSDWRYFEVALPGAGQGSRSIRGSTTGIDYPLDLSAIIIQKPAGTAEKPFTKGSVQFGAVYLTTQQPRADTLSVQLGYDDPEHVYAANRAATVTVQNGWREGKRQVALDWSLLDRDDEIVTRGRHMVELDGEQSVSKKIDLAPHAAKIGSRTGPLRIQVIATDQKDAGSAEGQIVLSKPDSRVALTGFETDRSYLGFIGTGVNPKPNPGDFVAKTSTAQKKTGTRSLELPWKKGQLIIAAIDPVVPGVPIEVSMWVHGDGSGAHFYPLIGDRFGVISGDDMSQWDLFLPRQAAGEPHNAVKVDWTGWREVKFRLPVIPESWNDDKSVHAYVPSYPLGLHLAISPAADKDSGNLYIDDIMVRTHLDPDHRVAMKLKRAGASNLVLPGTSVDVDVANWGDASAGARKVKVSGGVFDWRGTRIAGVDRELNIAAGQVQTIKLADKIGQGAYRVHVSLSDGENVLSTVAEDLLVLDAVKVLGASWKEDLKSDSKLRAPLRDRFRLISHDWDWAEFQPGNLQPDTLLDMIGRVRADQQEPYAILGYSAYWASGIGFEELESGQLPTRADRTPGARWWGGTVDIFHAPERLDDWSNYTREMMKFVGSDVKAWMLWDGPDNEKLPLGVPIPRFAELMRIADDWRKRYCPKTPIIIGGMSRGSAIGYMRQLKETNAVDHVDGVNLRLDPGRLSPSDAKIPAYVEDLRRAMRTEAKPDKEVIITDLDWVVEREGKGLDAFDQAAYLVRATLLLNRLGAQHALMLQNGTARRLGQGLTYKNTLEIPPMRQQIPVFQFKPAWWGATRVRQMLESLEVVAELNIQDVYPGRTRGILYQRTTDQKSVAIIWRNNDPGEISFAGTGHAVSLAEDIFGTKAVAKDKWYAIGPMPTIFEFAPGTEPISQAIRRVTVRDPGQAQTWSQQVLADFDVASGTRWKYTRNGHADTMLKGRDALGRYRELSGSTFATNGSERFEVTVPKGSGLVWRKTYYLDDAGQKAEVKVNDKVVGTWDMTRQTDKMSKGLRRASYLVPADKMEGRDTAAVEVQYAGAANTAAWSVFAYTGGAFPLSAVGALHADSLNVDMRFARNVVGQTLQIGNTVYTNGVGVFAEQFQEYALNKQFSRFTCDVGIDYATKGKGSVVFEVHADDNKVWDSGLMDGLAPVKQVDLDVSGVERLRLIVRDGGDGNAFDAANWCEPLLHL